MSINIGCLLLILLFCLELLILSVVGIIAILFFQHKKQVKIDSSLLVLQARIADKKNDRVNNLNNFLAYNLGYDASELKNKQELLIAVEEQCYIHLIDLLIKHDPNKVQFIYDGIQRLLSEYQGLTVQKHQQQMQPSEQKIATTVMQVEQRVQEEQFKSIEPQISNKSESLESPEIRESQEIAAISAADQEQVAQVQENVASESENVILQESKSDSEKEITALNDTLDKH